jgi:hypothetical protein
MGQSLLFAPKKGANIFDAVANTYDAVGRLTETKLRAADSAVLNSHDYGYNLGGRSRSQVQSGQTGV